VPNKPEAKLRIDDLLILLAQPSRLKAEWSYSPSSGRIKPGFETPWFFVVFRVKPV
jgi:hypothetical protein